MAYDLAALAILVLPQVIEKVAKVLAIAKANKRDVAAVAAAVFGQRGRSPAPLDGEEEDTSHGSQRSTLDRAGVAQIKHVLQFRRMRRSRR
jgi:hypothetical protein